MIGTIATIGTYETRAGTMTTHDQKRARLREQAEEGEWLPPGSAATLLGVSRSTLVRMLNDGLLPYRTQPGAQGRRLVDPAALLRELRESEGAPEEE